VAVGNNYSLPATYKWVLVTVICLTVICLALWVAMSWAIAHPSASQAQTIDALSKAFFGLAGALTGVVTGKVAS
jgi:TRAP-type C4-dicarboxylate transport system permease small subunit